MDQVNQIVFYDAISSQYANLRKDREQYLETIKFFIIEKISTLQVSTVLDIGAGDGVLMSEIQKVARPQLKVIALEPSTQMIKQMSKDIKFEQIINSSIEDLSNVDLKINIDLATATYNVFGHIDDLDRVFKKISLFLNSPGYLIFDVTNPFNLNYGLLNFLKNLLFFIVNKKRRKVFIVEKNKLRTEMHSAPSYYYKNLLENFGYEVLDLIYINYKTGKKTCIFLGNILIIAQIMKKKQR